jgi:hypothetical protein
LPRTRGLPRGGPAIVLPVLDDKDRAVYLQVRYLQPRGRRYENPAASLVGVSPRIAELRTARSAADDNLVLVCEGMPDALTAAQLGIRAVSVLGAGLPNNATAQALAGRFASEHLVLAFDADGAGTAGAERLVELLGEPTSNRVSTLTVPARYGDLNAWLQGSRERFPEQFAAALGRTMPPLPFRPALGPAVTPTQVASHGLEIAL